MATETEWQQLLLDRRVLLIKYRANRARRIRCVSIYSPRFIVLQFRLRAFVREETSTTLSTKATPKFALRCIAIFESVATKMKGKNIAAAHCYIQFQCWCERLSISKHSKLSLYCNRIEGAPIFFTCQFFFYVNKLLQIVQSFFGLNVIRTDTPWKNWR